MLLGKLLHKSHQQIYILTIDYSIDYKNLSKTKAHLEKHMFSHATPFPKEAHMNEQGQKKLIVECKSIAA